MNHGDGASSTLAAGVDFRWLVTAMQEPALVLVPDQAHTGYRAMCANDRAAEALRTDASSIRGMSLEELLPIDTAKTMSHLCDIVLRSGQPIDRFAAAPDPLSDLTGASSTSVRIIHAAGRLLCTWVPGWQVVGPEAERDMATVAGVATADRLELAKAVDDLSDVDVGVFSFDLLSGRYVCSRGIYKIFGSQPIPGPATHFQLRAFVETGPELAHAWRALVRDGRPMDVEIRLTPALGGRRMRMIASAVRGPDDYPMAIRGLCSLLET